MSEFTAKVSVFTTKISVRFLCHCVHIKDACCNTTWGCLPWRCVPDRFSLDRCVLDRWVFERNSWTMRPFGNASYTNFLGPMDDASLTDLSRPWTAFRQGQSQQLCTRRILDKPWPQASLNPTHEPHHKCPPAGLYTVQFRPNLSQHNIPPPPVRDGSYGDESSKTKRRHT